MVLRGGFRTRVRVRVLTLTLFIESIAERGFNPQEFYDQMPGTTGQPHQIYPGMGFFLIEDVPEELAVATVYLIRLI